jgi:hypothetical protein
MTAIGKYSVDGRGHHSAIYDPVRQRMIIFGGEQPFQRLNETWELPLTSPPNWLPIAAGTPPPPRLNHSAI